MESKNIIITGDTPWILSKTEPEAIRRAVRDLQNDWYKVFGCPPLVLHEIPDDYNGVLIFIGKACQKYCTPPDGRESFCIALSQNDTRGHVLTLAGSDMRGTIYAIYTFSEKILGVDPWYFWNEILPKRRKSIELETDFNICQGSPEFRYRGWFINGEDMLTGSYPDPMGENHLCLTLFDKICETILRLKGNVIAPGTRPYPDEATRDLACRRGLLINDHHHTPLGLNVNKWPDSVPFSYITNPEIMEEMWRKCIHAQKHREMVWTVGYRGKGDIPFWNSDKNAPDTDEDRADVISRAVAKQVELIREVQPDAEIIFNMYGEQAELCKKGLLKIPEGVIKVWPNDGAGIMSDEGAVLPGDGAYFHITGCRNRIHEAVSPQRIYEELGRYVRAGATSFCLINVGNIRNFPLSISSVMDFIYSPITHMRKSPKDAMKDTLINWSRNYYGNELANEIGEIYFDFFACSNFRKPSINKPPYDFSCLLASLANSVGTCKASFNQVLPDQRLHWYMHALLRLYLKVLEGTSQFNDDLKKDIEGFNYIVNEPTAYLPELSVRAHALWDRIPEGAKTFYRTHVLTQIDVLNYFNKSMESLGRSVLDFMKDDLEGAISSIKISLDKIEKALDTLHNAETCKWETWYMYESLSCYWYTRDLLRCVLASLYGDNKPPIREFFGYKRHHERNYRYHDMSSGEYPLFHAAKGSL